MRVEHPDKYAEPILSISQPEEGYTDQRIRSLFGRCGQNVYSKTPIPVYLTTKPHLSIIQQLLIRPDIYGLDKAINTDVSIALSYGATTSR
jgi:hypothetical protein